MQNNNSSKIQDIDQELECVFEKLNEEDVRIACKFPLSEQNLKMLCLKSKCAVQLNCANLLLGIQKKIESEQPHIKDNPRKLLARVYKWYKNHPRARERYCEKEWRKLSDMKENIWLNTKINNLIKLGIHPKLLSTTYIENKSFDKAISLLKKLESEYELAKTRFHSSSSESESNMSLVTVINTQKSEFNTEDLIGANKKDQIVSELDLVFDSEEIIPNSAVTYDLFNTNGILFTSTQNNS